MVAGMLGRVAVDERDERENFEERVCVLEDVGDAYLVF